MAPATLVNEREQVIEVLRQAISSEEWWLTFDQVAERCQTEDRVRLSKLLSRMGEQDAIRIDRSAGRKRRRFALMTPEEFRELEETIEELNRTGALPGWG